VAAPLVNHELTHRFTPRARNAVMVAQNEARAAGHDQIRPEHLVLGLLSDPQSPAATAVVELGVPLATARQAVTTALPPPAGEVPALIPFDQQTRKVLELTFREALRLGHDYIGTEHILLALLELEDSEGVLSGLGIDKAAAQAHVASALAAVRAAHQGQ
jgi:ATP-dependent Clp protease ATP-binding subunit ClpA